MIPRIENDFVEVLQAVAEKRLHEVQLSVDSRSAVTVMTVSGGYPEAYEKGKEIIGLEKISDSIVFHAGTKEENGKILTNGGRVIAVTSFVNDFREALSTSYQNIQKMDFEGMYYRKDLGFDL